MLFDEISRVFGAVRNQGREIHPPDERLAPIDDELATIEDSQPDPFDL